MLQTFIIPSRLDEAGILPIRSESRSDMMVGTFPKNYNTGPSITGKVDVVANPPAGRPIIVVSLLRKLATSL